MTGLKVIKGAKGQPTNLDPAYRALEPDICDTVRSAEMLSRAEDQADTGLLSFAINQSLKLAEELKEKYYEAYKG